MAREETKRITSIGGQALLEGIMMRGPYKTEVAVRLPAGGIETKEMETNYLRDRFSVFRVPLLRGIASLVDSLRMGFQCLNYSAEKAGLDEEDEEPGKLEKWLDRHFGDKLMNVIMAAAAVLGVGLAIVLFFWLPAFLFNLAARPLPGLEPWRSLVEGLMRIVVFIAYIALCARVPDMKRVFQYHGAEHKTIFCYENEEELTVENVRRHKRFHPRCGTSFMILMLLLGVIVGFFIPIRTPFLRTIIKLLCIPLVVGVGYELIRLCGKYDNWLTRLVAAPGLWMQRLTVLEPDDSMIEVAIAAMKQVIPEDGKDLT